jgi:hypothetical protein
VCTHVIQAYKTSCVLTPVCGSRGWDNGSSSRKSARIIFTVAEVNELLHFFLNRRCCGSSSASPCGGPGGGSSRRVASIAACGRDRGGPPAALLGTLGRHWTKN